MRRFAPALFAALALRAGADPDPVARLGAESWREREAAMVECLKPEFRERLQEAAESADPETAWRARWALECLDWEVDGELAARTGNPFAGAKGLSEDELAEAVQTVMQDNRPSRLGVLLQAARRLPEGAARQQALSGLRVSVDGDVPWAAGRLASKDESARTGAALVLAWRGDKRGTDEIKRDLASAKPLLSRRIDIDALVALGDPGGAEILIGAVKEALSAKTPPDLEDIKALAELPADAKDVEETLFKALESDYGGADGAGPARDAALEAIARRGGSSAGARLAAWWDADPEKREHALPIAAALSDPAALAELAKKAAPRLGGEKATEDQLFTLAALQRLGGDGGGHRATVDRMAAREETPAALEQVAEVALEYLDAGEPAKAYAYLDKHFKKGADEFGPMALLMQEAAKGAKKERRDLQVQGDYNNEAWELVTHPERLANPSLAVRLMEHTCQGDPGLAPRGTMGAAYFRAGRYADAVKTLEQNLEPYYTGKEEDMAFLVMSYKRLGREADARKVESQCREWEAKSQKTNPMRAEMERVLREK